MVLKVGLNVVGQHFGPRESERHRWHATEHIGGFWQEVIADLLAGKAKARS